MWVLMVLTLWKSVLDPGFSATQSMAGSNPVSITIEVPTRAIDPGQSASVIISISPTDKPIHVVYLIGLRVMREKGDRLTQLVGDHPANVATQPTTQPVDDMFSDAIWPELEIECPYDPNQVWHSEWGVESRNITPQYIAPNDTKKMVRRIPGWALTTGDCRVRAILYKGDKEIAASPFSTIVVGHQIRWLPGTQPTTQGN
jgi:hypothetical protein